MDNGLDTYMVERRWWQRRWRFSMTSFAQPADRPPDRTDTTQWLEDNVAAPVRTEQMKLFVNSKLFGCYMRTTTLLTDRELIAVKLYLS